ncbi:unnamed protein product [Linum trigynum]|uniref:Gnk2-homologous domain-containing protein n=1 Tax=Linum trigynum TaxID=586398 RepID=A0AAV2GTN4_9ROSI
MAPAAVGYTSCGGVAPRNDSYPSNVEMVLSLLATATPTSSEMLYRTWYPDYKPGYPAGTASCYKYNAEACKTCLRNAHLELKQRCTAAHTTGAFFGANCNMEYWPIHDSN